MRSYNLATLRWLQVVLVLWTAASSTVSVGVSAVRNDFSFAGLITVDGENDDSDDINTETSNYAVPDATAELLTDLFLPAVTFDAVTFEIVAVTSTASDSTASDDKNIDKYMALGHAAAVAHNRTTDKATAPLRLWAVLQDTAQGDWPHVNLNITQRTAFIASVRDHVVRHELHGVHLDCAACMRSASDAGDNRKDKGIQHHLVHKLRFLNEIIESLHSVQKLVSVQIDMKQELPRYMYKNIDRVHLHSDTVEWPHKALLNHINALKKDHPCEAGGSCAVNKIHVAVPATAVASKAANAKGVTGTLPVADVWREILAAAYAPDQTGSGSRGVWNQTAAGLLDKADTWGDVDLLSPKTVRHKVAWAKRMGLGGVYVWNLQDDLCVADLAPAGIMLEAAAKTRFFNAEKLLQLLVVDQKTVKDDGDDDVRDEL
jgi:hypothetical protein